MHACRSTLEDPTYARDASWAPALPGGVEARALAFGPDGTLGVLTDSELLRVEPSGSIGPAGGAPRAQSLAYDALGRAWIGTRDGLVAPVPLAFGQAIDDVESLAVDALGRVAVVADGKAWLFESPLLEPRPLGRAHAVAALSDGFALIDRRGRSLTLSSLAAPLVLQGLPHGLADPVALAADRFDNIYIADRGLRAVIVVARTGRLLAWLSERDAKAQLDGIEALAVDGHGRVYLLHDRGHALARLD